MTKNINHIKPAGNGKRIAFLRNKKGLSLEDARLKGLLQRAMDREQPPEHLGMVIRLMIRS